MKPGLSPIGSFLVKIHAGAFFLSQGSMDGPLPRPRRLSETPGKPPASGKGPGCVQSLRLWRKWAEDLLFLQEERGQSESESALWPAADPGPGAAPRTTSSSTSSSPSKVVDEGKVSISGNTELSLQHSLASSISCLYVPVTCVLSHLFF